MSSEEVRGTTLCQRCKARPASILVSRVVNGTKTDRYLCESCAKDEGAFHIMLSPPFTVHHMLGGLIGAPGTAPRAQRDQGLDVRCPACGQSYQEFTGTGRLGCAHCYTAFREELSPLIRRVQAGTEHRGKVPVRTGGEMRKKRQLDELREALKACISREEFEKAAELRDQIRLLEQDSGAKGNAVGEEA